GVLCCEHVGSSRRWTGREERDAARLADIVAVSMERSARRAVEERSRIILEAIPQYVIVTDREGRPVDTSAIARRALEEDAGTSAMSRFQDLELRSLAGDLLPRSQWPGERARRGETVRGEIVEIGSRVTGEKRWLRATGAPVTVDGDVQGAVIIYEEVAEEIRIERVKREVLAAYAHDDRQRLRAALTEDLWPNRRRAARARRDGARGDAHRAARGGARRSDGDHA